MQHTNHLMMIEPVHFAFNEQTAENNYFQQTGNKSENVAETAKQEFYNLVNALRHHAIDVTVIADTPEPQTPDAVFPNNWISTHEDGNIVLYPMYAPNRRLERKPHVLKALAEKFTVSGNHDLTNAEQHNRFLEGTGSMVLDRENRFAYACLSPRTDAELFQRFCKEMNYQSVAFHAADKQGRAIYHTNVMMSVADRYAVICLESMHDTGERKQLEEKMQATGKEIITISFDQMNHFAGNMLQVHNSKGETFLVMSEQAYRSLTEIQIRHIKAYDNIIHADIGTIESLGGGSARCMIAEIFLPEKRNSTTNIC